MFTPFFIRDFMRPDPVAADHIQCPPVFILRAWPPDAAPDPSCFVFPKTRFIGSPLTGQHRRTTPLSLPCTVIPRSESVRVGLFPTQQGASQPAVSTPGGRSVKRNHSATKIPPMEPDTARVPESEPPRSHPLIAPATMRLRATRRNGFCISRSPSLRIR